MPRISSVQLVCMAAILAIVGSVALYVNAQKSQQAQSAAESALYLEWDHQQTTAGTVGADVLLAADLHYVYMNKWQAQNERGERINSHVYDGGYTQSFDGDPRMFFVRTTDRDELEVWRLRTPPGVTGSDHMRAVDQQASVLGLSVQYKLFHRN